MIHQVIPIIPTCQSAGLWADYSTKTVGFANQKTTALTDLCALTEPIWFFEQIASLISSLKEMDEERIKEAKSWTRQQKEEVGEKRDRDER